MTKPSKKSPEAEKAIDDLAQHMFGQTRTGAIHKNICVTCSRPAIEFRDDLSKKEYAISGMCQDCQDSVFG